MSRESSAEWTEEDNTLVVPGGGEEGSRRAVGGAGSASSAVASGGGSEDGAEEGGSPNFCRICHERSEDLIRPCNCRGSLENVHAKCIQMWLAHRRPDEMRCELCGYPFHLRVRTRPMVWFFLSGGPPYWLHLAYVIFIMRRIRSQVAVLVDVVPRTKNKNWKFYWRLLLHCFMLGHYVFFLVVDVKYIVRRWLRWRHSTSELIVYGK